MKRWHTLAALAATALVGLVVVLTGGSMLGPRGTGPDEPVSTAGRCFGVEKQNVIGRAPRYATQDLTPFTNDSAICRGLWLPRLDDWFVPQGLALDGPAAWVSGYRWRPQVGMKHCQVLRVDLRSGKQLAFQAGLEARLPGGEHVTCRHGGGTALTSEGLWIAEQIRLWLLDPRLIGTPEAVKRVWRLDEPVSGGFMVTGGADEIALGDFRRVGGAKIHWYDTDELLGVGVTTLTEGSAPSMGEVTQTRVSRTPRYSQGGAVAPGRERRRPFTVSSTTTCASLRTPSGRRVHFAPGAEGIAFDGRGGLWTALESGTRAYQTRYEGRPLVPGLVRYDVQQLLGGEDSDCAWE